MANADLGHKQKCASCGIKFYDLNKKPIICPSCKAKFDPENLLKSRRGRESAKSSQEEKNKDDTEEEDKSLNDDMDSDPDDNDYDDDEDVLPTGDEPLIGLSSDDDDDDDDEGGVELIDVLEDDEGIDDDEDIIGDDELDDENS